MQLFIGILVGCVPIAIGIGFLVAALVKRSRYLALAREGAEVEGRVVELSTEGRESRSPRAVVEFKDREGRSHRIESTIGTARWRMYEDSTVTVAYDPENPFKDSRIREDSLMWVKFALKLAPFLVIMGLAIMALGFAAHRGIL
jgi:hypothetical protein